MKKTIAVSTIAAALGMFSASAAAVNANAFIAGCTPSQEAPGTPTPGTPLQACVANFLLVGGDALRYTIRCNNITSNITAGHIHPGTADQTGAPIFDFGVTATAPVNGVIKSGVIRRVDLGDAAFDDLLAKMRSDNAYVNIHTQANAGGEVRGQITPFVVPRVPALEF